MYWFFVLSVSIIFCVTFHYSEWGWTIESQARVVQWQTPYGTLAHPYTIDHAIDCDSIWILSIVSIEFERIGAQHPTVCTLLFWHFVEIKLSFVCECQDNNVNGYQQRNNNTPDMIRLIPIGAYFLVSSSQFPSTTNSSEWAAPNTMFQFIVVVVYRISEFIDNS